METQKSKTLHSEVLVVGAGLLGSSVAMHLAKLGAKDIRVVDFDLEGSLSSSELNAGGVRATWVQPVNILSSKLSIDYFAQHAEEVGYRPCGYLWLHTAEKLPGALQAREKQIAHGWDVESWDVAELRRRVPFIDKTDGIAGAVFAPRDGLVNPNRLKNHYREIARAAGVRFEDRLWIRSGEVPASGRIKIEALQYASVLSQEEKQLIYEGGLESLPSSRVTLTADRVVNCAGAWASRLATVLGYACPSKAVRRQVCIFDCRDVDLNQYGMIVDTSGVYFHPEATNGLAGFANHSEPEGVNFAYDGDSFFMEQIWPALYERASAFERLRHLTGWAGLYEVSPDESAIVGEAVGRFGRIFEAHSFSGHGAMHSYAAGLALAEKMAKGRYDTLDLSILSGDRFEKGKPVRESLVI